MWILHAKKTSPKVKKPWKLLEQKQLAILTREKTKQNYFEKTLKRSHPIEKVSHNEFDDTGTETGTFQVLLAATG